VIPRKNQDILNALASWILQHEHGSIFTLNSKLAFRFFLAFAVIGKKNKALSPENRIHLNVP